MSEGGAYAYACLFCESGKEKQLVWEMTRFYDGIEAYAVEKIRRRRENGRMIEEKVILLPGYVFCRLREGETLPRLPHMYRFLLTDGKWPLMGADREFAGQVFAGGGVLGLSRAMMEGDRIRIIDGPMKNYEGSIIRVNKRFQNCEILTRIGEREIHIWLGYELIQPAE